MRTIWTLEGTIKSYRWTTRPKRKGEIDSRNYDGTQSTHGFFVTEKEFLERKNRGELVGVHRYPDPETGNWYGFPVAEMNEALQRGENLSEQVDVYDSIDEIVKTFEKYGTVTKKLFFTTLEDIRWRLWIRHFGDNIKALYLDKKEIIKNSQKFNFPCNAVAFLWDEKVSSRFLDSEKNLLKFLDNICSFDEICFVRKDFDLIKKKRKKLLGFLKNLKQKFPFTSFKEIDYLFKIEFGKSAFPEFLNDFYGQSGSFNFLESIFFLSKPLLKKNKKFLCSC